MEESEAPEEERVRHDREIAEENEQRRVTLGELEPTQEESGSE